MEALDYEGEKDEVRRREIRGGHCDRHFEMSRLMDVLAVSQIALERIELGIAAARTQALLE